MTIELGAKNATEIVAPWIHTFLYGASGAGKSLAASSWPRPVFIVPRNEGSVVTLRGLDVPYFEVVDMSQTPLKDGVGSMNHVIDHLVRIYNQNPEACPFDTIVVESLSHYSDLVIEQLTNSGKKPMSQFEWGLLTSHLRNIQARLRSLDVHVVFTSLDKVEQGEDKAPLGYPLIQGQSAIKLPAACDIIGYCEVIEGKNAQIYRAHFRRYKHFMARTRFRDVPPMIEDFKFSKIADFVR